MTNEFKRTPTHGENDVDLRVATEPRRITDAVLSQIIATKDGEIAALTDEVTHLAEKLAERDALLADIEFVITGVAPGSKLGSLLVRIHDLQRDQAAPQPVDAAQAVPGLQRQAVATVVSRCGDDLRVGWLRPERCTVGTLLFCAVEPTDTTKGA